MAKLFPARDKLFLGFCFSQYMIFEWFQADYISQEVDDQQKSLNKIDQW